VRAGVFGGSFDPVHLGHLSFARQAVERLHLDQVRFVPAALQPLKAAGPRAPAADRVAMLRLALQGLPGFVLDTRELDRSGPSFTVDTLRDMKAERPADQLFLMLGADAARELPRWREAAEVVKLAQLVVVARPGAEVPGLPAGAMTLDIQPVEVSATAIRDAVKQGASIEHMVPGAVADYIRSHGLYRTGA
jgi:nicotinate-nucleotide adenylyltransferase